MEWSKKALQRDKLRCLNAATNPHLKTSVPGHKAIIKSFFLLEYGLNLQQVTLAENWDILGEELHCDPHASVHETLD